MTALTLQYSKKDYLCLSRHHDHCTETIIFDPLGCVYVFVEVSISYSVGNQFEDIFEVPDQHGIRLHHNWVLTLRLPFMEDSRDGGVAWSHTAQTSLPTGFLEAGS